MDTIQATGAGGAGIFSAINPNITTGASLTGGIQSDDDKRALGHGVIMALISLAVAPVDLLAAGALRRWPVLQLLTSVGYVGLMIGGLVLGIRISGEYLAVSYDTTPARGSNLT
jgi:hypothetical protein